MGIAVGSGVFVAVGTGVRVAVAVGAGVFVAVGMGVAVAAGTDVAVGGAVGAGVGVAGASSIVMIYVLKRVSVVTAHTPPASSVSHRCSNNVHWPPFTRYRRTRPAAQAASSPSGSANRRSTPRE